CSGLRMATIFGAMAVGLVLLIERPWWDKLIILISALPIALFVNVIRIAVTSIVHWAYQGNETVIQQVHDYAGYAMPILALGLLWFVLAILDRLTLTDTDRVAPIYIPGAIPVPRKRGGNAD
ncbi:MAG: exosortase/archaeosortase family protein, partial [Pirellulales bacterium]|nr:exosortase/archaeosortase family protein [Pirellulales bacterium]